MSGSPSKRYCFTINNYGPEDEARLTGMGEASSEDTVIKYLIYGREVGASGTRHLQGFIEFAERKRFTQVKVLVGATAHIEKAKGSPGDNRTYCSKEGDFEEWGVLPPAANNTTKLTDTIAEAVIADLRANRVASAAEHLGASNWLRNSTKFIQNALVGVDPVSRPDISVKWYYGLPGYGKSRRAHHELKDPYMKDPRTKWWHGYMLQTEVIMDDMAPEGIHLSHLLRWFDRYKCYVETKGGQSPLFARKFIVTSNFHPSNCFVGSPLDSIKALLRRIQVVHFIDKWQPPQDEAQVSECSGPNGEEIEDCPSSPNQDAPHP